MRVLTVSDTDDSGMDEGEPLLVARVDGPMIRRVLALVVDQLAAPTEARPAPRQVVPMRPTPPVTPDSVADRTDP